VVGGAVVLLGAGTSCLIQVSQFSSAWTKRNCQRARMNIRNYDLKQYWSSSLTHPHFHPNIGGLILQFKD
jgi:hypothetical protein